MELNSLRLQISRTHPIVGEGYRLLDDHERVQLADETATVSTMLSLAGDKWSPAIESEYGLTVGELCGDKSPYMDCQERIFRRLSGLHSLYDPSDPQRESRLS